MSDEPKAGVSVARPPASSGTATIGWAILAIATQVALVDASIETFWSGSPLRWWIAPPVLVFVALSAWLWRPGGWAAKKWGWQGAGSWSVGGLLLLFAVSAWLPAGQTNGVRMLLQPTATVLTFVSAAAVLFAAFVLFRALGLLQGTARLVARGIVIALAAYAVTSLGLAIHDRSSFVTLFQGGAAWHRLPRWLQGSFIGALVLLPLAILAQIAQFAKTLRRQQPVRLLVHQTTALVMTFVMALSGLVRPGLARPGLVATGGSFTGIPSTLDQAAAAVSNPQIRRELFGQESTAVACERYSRAVENELKRPGADPSDITARSAALGGDVGKIFEFVRDHVMLEPYNGQLRGARGALAAGAGNALDRALLGQALLKAAGVETRLVKGRLSPAQSESLLQRYLKTNPIHGSLAMSSIKPGDSFVATSAQQLASETGLREQGITTLLRRAQARADIFWWKTDEQRASQFAFVSDQLRQGGVKPGTEWSALRAQLQERLQEHYWLQVPGADGAWSDFDTAFPEARPGAALGSDPIVLSEVPEDRIHRFEFSLVYRTRVEGALKEEVLLTRAFASGDALFTPIEFRIQPADPGLDLTQLLSSDAEAKVQALRKMVRFQGLLRVGSRVIDGRAFDLEGHTFDAPGGNPMASPGGLMGGMLGFGGEGGGGGAFVDLQVVLRLTGPGRAPMTQTRTLVRAEDLKAPAFAPPLLEWGFLVQPQWVSPEFVGFQTLTYLKDITDAVTAAHGPWLSAPPPIPVQLLELALARQIAAAGILAKQGDINALIDEPMLTVSGHRLTGLRPDGGRIDTQRTIDVVENSIRYAAKEARSQAAAFDIALRQGVADCVLEQSFLEESTRTESESGANLFQRAQLERRPILLTTSSDTAGLQAAGLRSVDVEWIRSNESTGARLVIAQTSGGRAAWWSVRPDGNAVLRVSGGQGQALTENAEKSAHILLALICGYKYGKAHESADKALSALCMTASLGGVACIWVGFEALALALLGLDVGLVFGEAGLEVVEFVDELDREDAERQKQEQAPHPLGR